MNGSFDRQPEQRFVNQKRMGLFFAILERVNGFPSKYCKEKSGALSPTFGITALSLDKIKSTSSFL